MNEKIELRMDHMELSDFECQGCGACCRQDGYVRLRPEEPDIIAAFLNMDVYAFIEQYTIVTKDRQTLSLIDKEETTCIFLDPDGCRIHPVKPSQCRDFPLKWRFKDFQTICQGARMKKQNTPDL